MGQARAQWSAHKEGPDVFGTTKVIAVTSGDRQSLVVQCNDKDELYIAYIFLKKKFDEVSTSPADLLFQIDGATPTHLAAEIRNWNDDYAGVVADGRSPEIVNVLRSIRDGHVRINVGVIVAGNRDSASFETSGSTSALEDVIAGCKLAESGGKH